MSWVTLPDQRALVLAAFAEAEEVIGTAFARAVGKHGFTPGEPFRRPELGPDEPSYWLYRGVRLPDCVSPFEVLHCNLDLSLWAAGPEVSAWVSVTLYAGRGILDEHELWRSAELVVADAPGAAAAVRQVAAEMVAALDQLDLTPYLVG